MSKKLFLLGILIAIPACSLKGDSAITSFEECVAAGNVVMESYPRQCRTEEGVTFVEEVDQSDITPPSEKEMVFCTQDAKECPDGSYVGRVGSNCEFAPCPGE